MKARKKGTQEWKEYKEVFGPYGEFIGLETLGYTKSVDEIIAEMGIDVAKDPFARSRIQPQYMSAVLPLECFDLWGEPDWASFRREAAKDILCARLSTNGNHINFDYAKNRVCDSFSLQNYVGEAISYADELIKLLKQE